LNAEQRKVIPQHRFDWGELFESGSGVVADLSQALSLYQKAASQDDSDAELHIADLLAKGKGVGKNDKEALVWYRRAVEHGSLDAAARIARGCFWENSFSLRGEECLYWNERAATTGNVEAMYTTAAIYFTGHVYGAQLMIDLNKAVMWYQKAADKGYANAIVSLGCMYYEGKGVPKDRKTAGAWFEKVDRSRRPVEEGLFGHDGCDEWLARGY